MPKRPARTELTLAQLAKLTRVQLAKYTGIPVSTLKHRKARGLSFEAMIAPSRNAAKPIAVDGVTYPSLRSAKRSGKRTKPPSHTEPQPIEVDGITYPSMRAAARATGLYRVILVELREFARKQQVAEVRTRLNDWCLPR